ncbi:non-specific serine/threonine protein kinase [Nocardioides dubius]|uniref:serine/threonine-protein kinase n=1 Tax=Nocardioides dubius TaxID=317019 RepID=UPI0039ECBF30
MSTATSENSPPGEIHVGPYRLLARIGEGGMGVVHLGQKPGGARVAIKVLRPHVVGDDEARARLAREVNSLSLVRSPRVAEIVDADPWGPIPYVATRYVPGLSLHDHVREEGPIVAGDLRHFAFGLAEALTAVHAVGVLHRDIKPSNVLMEGRNPVLIDFGLARLDDDLQVTRTGYLLGTPGYIAPEVLAGEQPTTASDVHSWATTVAFAALGRPPFGTGHTMAVMDRVRRGDHDLSGLDPAIGPLLRAALAPEPAARPTLKQVREALAPVGTGAPVAAAAPIAEPPMTMPFAASPDFLPTDVQHATAVTTPLGTSVPPAAADGLSGVAAAGAAAAEAPRATTPLTDHLRADAVTRQAPPTPGQPLPGQPTAQPWTGQPSGPPPPARPYAAVPNSAPYQMPPEPRRAASVAWPERLRRWTLGAGGVGVTAGAVAFAPWLAAIGISIAVVLIRAGSLSGSTLAAKRARRGNKWHDLPFSVVAAPWHAVVSSIASVALLAWAAMLGSCMLLIALVAGAGDDVALALTGVVSAAALWTGPGSSRLRSPLHRVASLAAVRPVPWLVLALALGGVSLMALLIAGVEGPLWEPASAAPWDEGTWLGRWL